MTIDSRNSFFSASLLFRSLRNGKFLPDNLWEESILLIEASTTVRAHEKATELGKARQVSYQTSEGDELTWEFFKVERVFQIEDSDLIEGVELFSRHLRDSEVKSLIKPFNDS